MRTGAWLFLGGWAIFWCAGTLFFDVMLVRGVVMQSRATQWPIAKGRVTSSKVEESSDGEGGRSYTAKIRYVYAVDGRQFEGDRLRYNFGYSSSRNATVLVNRFPVNAEVDVHFNRSEPTQAVLIADPPGGTDLFGTIFLLPFNLIMLFCLRGAWNAIRYATADKPDGPAGGGVTVIEDSPELARLRLTGFTPFWTAAVAAGGVAFLLVFVIAALFSIESVNPSIGGWLVVLTVAAFAYRWQRGRFASGWYDLEIDGGTRTLLLPGRLKRAGGEVLRFDDVAGIDVAEKVRTQSEESMQYGAKLRLKSGEVIELMKSGDRETVEAFAKYVRRRIALDVAGRVVTSPALTTAG